MMQGFDNLGSFHRAPPWAFNLALADVLDSLLDPLLKRRSPFASLDSPARRHRNGSAHQRAPILHVWPGSMSD